jgi:hypothetical protein
MAKRIQRKRTKGWRMPDGAVYVGRPTKWGNPWKVDPEHSLEKCLALYRRLMGDGLNNDEVKFHLRGKDLVCWCPLDQPCHADVLLEIANS